MHSIKYRLALVALVALGATFAQGAMAQTKPLKLGINQTPSQGTPWLADAWGLFKAEGVNVEIVNFRSPTELASAAASGAVDLLASGIEVPAIFAVRGAAPWRDISALYGASAFSLVVRPDLQIAPGDVKALKGKTISTSGLARPSAFVLKAMLKDAGLNPDTDFNYVEVPPGPEGVAVWEQLKPDAGIVNEPVTTAIIQRGTAKMFIDLREGKNGPLSQVPQAALTAPMKLIQSDPADLHKVVKAICKAAKRGKANPQEAADTLAKAWGADSGGDVAVVKGAIVASAQAFTANPAEAPTMAWLQVLVDAKILPALPKFTDVVDTSFAPDWGC